MKNGPLVFERGENIYFVTPLAPMTPSDEEIAAYAFGDVVAKQKSAAPNPNIAWFAGHYVEADTPNRNGAQWTAGEIAIKHLTPMYMPVTVMHDPRTAVGVIADVGLKVPDSDQVPRAKLDTALALWAHRFPEAVEEALHNYRSGTLMQSMECFAPAYDCSVCGMTFHKQPQMAEKRDWCDHLKQSNPTGGYMAGSNPSGETLTAVRILRDVCFTGTGLIYGTRGARGADPNAHLEVFAEEVAEFHERSHVDRKRTQRPRRKSNRMDPVEISRSEYDSLRDKARELERVQAQLDEERAAHDKTKSERDEAKGAAEKFENEKAQAVERAEAAEGKVQQAEETARQVSLRDERLEALGDGFKAALDKREVTKKNLHEQAKTYDDEAWKNRLEEVAELLGVKTDEAASESDNDDPTFSREETARAGAGNLGGSGGGEPHQAAVGSVIGGLFKRTAPQTEKS